MRFSQSEDGFSLCPPSCARFASRVAHSSEILSLIRLDDNVVSAGKLHVVCIDVRGAPVSAKNHLNYLSIEFRGLLAGRFLLGLEVEIAILQFFEGLFTGLYIVIFHLRFRWRSKRRPPGQRWKCGDF
ncbi:MAG: hypothetical protein BWY06_02868 [Candidatus Latescibacteria bacterium ADurb.Bin168]|nr:MAG: hypothetical protein BWY06_02868 [Candidatus Latescibacteria bacterium ADurb.Bin168]